MTWIDAFATLAALGLCILIAWACSRCGHQQPRNQQPNNHKENKQ